MCGRIRRGSWLRRRSRQPVLHIQIGHALEILEVAREQRCVVGDHDAGDPQVHSGDAGTLGAQLFKRACRAIIPRHYGPPCQLDEHFLRTTVSYDETNRTFRTCDLRKLSSQDLLDVTIDVAIGRDALANLALNRDPASMPRTSSLM